MRTHRRDKAACAYFVAAIRRTNSKQFEFVQQMGATKFCRSDNDFYMLHEAICCSNLSRQSVTVICRIVCHSNHCERIMGGTLAPRPFLMSPPVGYKGKNAFVATSQGAHNLPEQGDS